MAISQGKVLTNIVKVVQDISEENFIFDFLLAYGFPKASVTRLQKGDKTRNVAHEGDIAIKKQIYFKQVPIGSDLEQEVEALSKDDLISRHDIRFLIVTDFQDMAASDLAAEETLNIPIDELAKNYTFFLPLAGFEKAIIHSEHPADVRASEKMGRLFDLIKENNDLTKPEDIHALNVFLTRLLFCFYAEDTGIFEEQQMTAIIKSTTQVDGSDLDEFLYDLFTVLNLPEGSEQRKAMPAHLQAFPYVNGGLFKVDEPVPAFSKKSRRMLLECGDLSWAEINPDIFGSMFQAVIDEEQRGNLGQHYTSVSNIMKVIQPLFLDKLWEELERSKKSENKLKQLLIRIQNIRVFDPACGSGNFLIIAFKELRKFEMAVIDQLNTVSTQSEIYFSGIKLSQFYGIELDDFAHEVGILSLWLAEHQMNMEFEDKFGVSEPALPLRDSGNIVCENSLQIDWNKVCPAGGEIYICGNPPFLGTSDRSDEQTEDMKSVFASFKSIGYLDFVAAWFWKAAQYIVGKNAEFAFVATNSICQGDQASILWPPIFELDLSISFCFKTFKWSNNAKNQAAVHVVIVGLSNNDSRNRHPRIFELLDGKTMSSEVENIGPYLFAGGDLAVIPRTRPFGPVSKMIFGNKPTDGGNLFVTKEEREEFIFKYPDRSNWVRRVYGANEFLNGGERWCFWLEDASLEEVMKIPELKERCENVRALRLKAGHAAALRGAERPHTFLQLAQPKEGSYLLIPCHSSERRKYIPIGFMNAHEIATNANQMVPNATLYEFGILTSEIHNDWMRTVAGRLKSDYRYSATLVYNTFPWPEVDDIEREKIQRLAEEVLLIREDFPDKTLAELYDPGKMPIELFDAHAVLDESVERLYREKPFSDVSERLEYLFGLYEKMVEKEQLFKRK